MNRTVRMKTSVDAGDERCRRNSSDQIQSRTQDFGLEDLVFFSVCQVMGEIRALVRKKITRGFAYFDTAVPPAATRAMPLRRNGLRKTGFSKFHFTQS